MSHAPQVESARAAALARITATARDTAAPPVVYDYSEVFRHFRPIFESADVTIANLETTLRSDPPYTGYPSFAAPAELAFALREAGVTIATTANNHICDKGAAGIRRTLAILDSAEIMHTGAFLDSADRQARNPLRFSAGGMRFALLAYTYGTNGLAVPKGMMVNLTDTAVIARDLALARAGDTTDCVIVSYHWGEEYRTRPTQAQRRLAEWTRARGADIIIGGHPHVVEPIEVHLGTDTFAGPSADSPDVSIAGPAAGLPAVVGATYFSLGNFVSNQRGRRSDGGIVAEITVRRTDSLPVSYEFGWRLGWVHTFLRDGRHHYQVLPADALDTLPEPALSAARRFAVDTRELLRSDSLAVEK